MTVISLYRINTTAYPGGALPVVLSQPVEVVVDAPAVASDPQNEFDALADQDMIWRVTANDGACWVKFGTGTPVAAAGDGNYIPDGETLDFAVTEAGEIPALIEA